MALSKTSNRKTINVTKNKKSSIESLPRELLTEVIAKAAASSFTTFFSAKKSYKFLKEASNDNYVYQNMTVERSPMFSWWRCKNQAAYDSFWERCKECGNTEALYLQGVVDYFGSRAQEESGLECLNQAANLGHIGARYTLGIILLLSEEDELKKKGIQFLGDVKKSNIRLIECRKRLEYIIRRIWKSNKFRRERSGFCVMKHKYSQKSGWESDDEDDIRCDACRCEREVAAFCRVGFI